MVNHLSIGNKSLQVVVQRSRLSFSRPFLPPPALRSKVIDHNFFYKARYNLLGIVIVHEFCMTYLYYS